MKKRSRNFGDLRDSSQKRLKNVFQRDISDILVQDEICSCDDETGELGETHHEDGAAATSDARRNTDAGVHLDFDAMPNHFRITNEVHELLNAGQRIDNPNFEGLENDDAQSCCSSCDDGEDECSADAWTDAPHPIDEALYDNAAITVREFILCVGRLKTNLKQPNSHTCQTLRLISQILPQPNRCPTSFYKFKQGMDQMGGLEMKKHYYCSNCVTLTENSIHDTTDEESVEDEELIPEEYVSCDCVEKKKYFIEIPLIPQLKCFYKRPGFYNKLVNRPSPDEHGNLRDIQDGSIYKNESNSGILSIKINISFLWYTDGVKIFQSSRFCIWGFFLIILECKLPLGERFKIENVILIALWFGDEKPAPNLFLGPLRDSLRDLYHGVEFYVEDLKTNVIIRGILLCGTGDLPALALFLRKNQYNGRFGCHVCVIEGRTVQNTRTYPYFRNFILRTDEDTEIWSAQALEIRKPVCGVKGPTMIAKICKRPTTSTAIDAMHNIFIGNSKKLTELWFHPKYAGEDFNISHLVKIADERLKAIKPPSFVARRPRSIETHLAYWKATEHYYWLFDFSLIVVQDLLPRIYFEHYKCYVLAMRYLHSNVVTPEMRAKASELIHEFLSRFALLYGEKNETCNVHCTGHLVEMVRRLGPLQTYSCFLLEALNGTVKGFVHSSNKPELQIFSNLDLHIKLNTLRHEWLRPNTVAFEYFECNTGPQKRMKLVKIDEFIDAVGKVSHIKSAERQQILDTYNLQGTNVFSFNKLYKQKMLFTSVLEDRERKTESFYVKFNCQSHICNQSLCFGMILKYYRVTDCECKNVCKCEGKTYASLKKIRTSTPFSVNLPGAVFDYIHECLDISNSPQLIEVNDIVDICFHVALEDGKSYICENVNNFGVK